MAADGLPRYTPRCIFTAVLADTAGTKSAALMATAASHHQDGFGAPRRCTTDPDQVCEDVVVTSFWRDFEQALRRARRILVLGHL
jgi:hypothetical protein